MSEESVRVAVRIRPLIESEIEKGFQNCLNVYEEENQIRLRSTDKAFTFDHIVGSNVNQKQFYLTTVQSLIDNIFKGYNITVLAYGQTGSGKTYSMGTNYSEGDVGNEGIIPQAVEDIFNRIASLTDYNFQISVSFMELYNEQLYDLLSEKLRKDSVVEIREDQKGIKFTCLTEKPVRSSYDVLQMLMLGSQNRATGSTAMNSQSSRSHAVFTITVHQQQTGVPGSAKSSKFHLVDLAGSERSKKTQATGDRFKEGVNINKGLLALGNVISQLGDNHVPGSFVCYRDSKLTRLLQDSLGGNSVTLMIACISPADYNMEETLSTLRYADRAKKIKNKPIVNQDAKDAEINRLNSVIRELQLELINQNGSPRELCSPEHFNLVEKNRALTEALYKFTSSINQSVLMQEKIEAVQVNQDKLLNELILIKEDLKTIIDGESDEERIQRLEMIYTKINDIIENCKKSKEECTADFDNSMSNLSSISANLSASQQNFDNFDNSVSLDEKQEELVLKQAERQSAVMDIDKDILKKEEMIIELLKTSQVHSYQKVLEETEKELKSLQAEKEELIEKLKNNACAKLAETRRQKVQELEKKINDLQKKILEQNRTIKSKEKSDELIRTLKNEVNSLKHNKVKLIREMKKETDKFNQWKQLRDKQFQKLEYQDRKRQNEMNKLQVQCDKQKNVLKRKLEEASNVNKRLREALDNQRKYKNQREKSSGSKEEIQNAIMSEISMMCRLVDAESILEQMMKDREIITKEINNYKLLSEEKPEFNYEIHINSLEEYLTTRNNQIAEVQQRIFETKEELQSNPKWQTIINLIDAKASVKLAYDFIVANRKKFNKKNQDYDDMLDKYDKVLGDHRKLEIENKKLKEQIEDLQKKHSESIQYNETMSELKIPKGKLKTVAKRQLEPQMIDDDFNSSIEEDNVMKDPDWTRTPLYQRLRSFRRPSEAFKPSESTKRNSDGDVKCACKKKCDTRLCKCRKNFQACFENCDCNKEFCNNRNQDEASKPFFPDLTFNVNALEASPNKKIKTDES